MSDINLVRCALVIPCFKVSNNILNVIKSIGPEVDRIYIIDDGCPENSGNLVEKNSTDKRVSVIYNLKNIGIGGATKRGFHEAFKDNKIDICIKIDGDGQMDSNNISKFLEQFKKTKYLYVKGNRFHAHKDFFKMPYLRIFGNFVLSSISKITTGQYNVFDINNGFIALHKNVYKNLNLKNISNNFFFETSMVAEMRNIGCKILDLNIDTIYNGEKSNLIIKRILYDFITKHISIFLKRIFNEYVKKKNYLMILLITGILLSLILFFYIKYFSYLFIILIFIFYLKDKNFKHIEN